MARLIPEAFLLYGVERRVERKALLRGQRRGQKEVAGSPIRL